MESVKPNKLHSSEARWGLLMCLPGLIGLALFILLPFMIACVLSFTNYRLNSPLPTRWIGFENYARVFSDSGFSRSILNNLIFAAVIVPVQTSLALALALLVNRPLKGMVLFRTLFFMPVIYPMALVAVVWALIFAPGDAGMMNQILTSATFGLWNPGTDFLRDPRYAMAAIIVMSIWQGVGFQMVIMLAGLQAIPESLYEAAAIDRAGRWRQFVHVTLPQMRNTILFVAMVTTILAFRLFDQVWILTQGGPNNATSTILYEAYIASRERNQIGLGSAMSIVLFAIVCIAAFAQHRLVRQEREVA